MNEIKKYPTRINQKTGILEYVKDVPEERDLDLSFETPFSDNIIAASETSEVVPATPVKYSAPSTKTTNVSQTEINAQKAAEELEVKARAQAEENLRVAAELAIKNNNLALAAKLEADRVEMERLKNVALSAALAEQEAKKAEEQAALLKQIAANAASVDAANKLAEAARQAEVARQLQIAADQLEIRRQAEENTRNAQRAIDEAKAAGNIEEAITLKKYKEASIIESTDALKGAVVAKGKAAEISGSHDLKKSLSDETKKLEDAEIIRQAKLAAERLGSLGKKSGWFEKIVDYIYTSIYKQ